MATVLLWMWLGILGFLLSRALLRSPSPWLNVGAALPLSMTVLLGTAYPLALMAGHPQGWILATLLLFVGTVVLYVKREALGAPEIQPFGLSPWQWGVFMTLLSMANFVMRVREGVGPEDDYWIHFPLIALLNRGEFPPPNPFFYDLSLHGHFGRDYLIAVLGWYAGGGESLLSAQWVFNHLLLISTFFLSFGLGHRAYGVSGGFLTSTFLFFGISVGSRVGLMDTYDNNNLLVYCLLLLFVAIETRVQRHWASDVFLAFALGIYGIIYETHMLLFLMVLWCGPFLWARAEEGWSWRVLIRPLALSLGSLAFCALLGGPIQDLTLRALGVRQVEVDHAATYQAQRVEITFPKQKLFQILVGPESYRRLSYVYQGRMFESLHSRPSNSGEEAKSDFLYVYIWSKDVLLMHWMALYLGFPAGLWLLRRRQPEGSCLWLFALFSFLVPGLVDFGPVHEREYFRWEFAAGFGFAGALAILLAERWREGQSRWWKVAVVVLAILTTLGGERKINRTFIEIEKMNPAQRERATSIWYPSPRDWFLGSQELAMDAELLEASLALRKLSQPQDRMLTDLDARGHWEIFQESTVCGLAGLRSVGHSSPPPWMQDGIAPFFRTAAWNAFWQTGDPRILPSLRARWILSQDPKNRVLLDRLAEEGVLQLLQEFGEVSIWRYGGKFAVFSPDSEASSWVLEEIERPWDAKLQSEVASPLTLALRVPTEVEADRPVLVTVSWLPKDGTEPGGPIEPLSLQVEDLGEPGSGWRFSHHLVPPLVEGGYNLEVRVDGRVVNTSLEADSSPVEVDFSWTEVASLAQVREHRELEVKIDPGTPDLRPPLRLGLRLFRTDENRYSKPFGFEAMGWWDGSDVVLLEPLDQGLSFPLPDHLRADLFLVDRSGREVKLEASPDNSEQ